MKKLTVIFFLLTGLMATNFAVGQVIKLKTRSVSIKAKINNRWSDWTDWESTSVLILMDLSNERITIFSKEKQIYDIIRFKDKYIDSDGDEVFAMTCINEDGLTCQLRLMKLNSQNGRNQLYIDFNDMKWVYNVYTLD